jgi:pilus assembly protein Flp/PilA
MMKKAIDILGAFGREEDGVALTEYLILLGLLVGGVVLTVQLAGNNLEGAWNSWSTFWSDAKIKNPL